MIKKILLIFCFCIITVSTFAQWPSWENEKIATILLQKLESYYDDQNSKILLLSKINNVITLKIDQKRAIYSNKKIVLLEDIKKVLNEEIFKAELNIKQQNQFAHYQWIPTLKEFKLIGKNVDNIFLKNGVWYTYTFRWFEYYDNNRDITKRNLQSGWMDLKTTLLSYNEEQKQVILVRDSKYSIIKLVSDDIIYGIPDKYNFLKTLKLDKNFYAVDTDSHLQELQDTIISDIQNKTKQEKISFLYQYVINHLSYSSDFNNNEIYSGLASYKNKEWVCQWYATLFLFLLNLSWVSDVEFMPGDVIDSTDFPNIWHAWIRIWDQYFDPTFDDPIGWEKISGWVPQKYFNLPKDIFYTNRYNKSDTPENLKGKPLLYRQALVKQRLAVLTKKYPQNKYRLLKEFEFRKSNNLNQFEKITPQKLENIVTTYEVDNFKILNKNQQNTITHISFFELTDEQSVINLLEQKNYNLTGFVLFKWKNWHEEAFYRLSNDFTIE